jgi:eukaryotic-like serine/threonine-protein kinase
MVSQSLVDQLVEEALDSDLTPEEVCAKHPELLSEVRTQWQRCRRLNAELEVLFPSSHAPRGREAKAPLQLSSTLPRISGYEVESILGRGGMGVVYKARQLRLNRPVAVKMLLAGNLATKPETTRFTREAEAVAALRHANVVQIYDIGDHEGCPYFTMEFMEGGTLAAKLAGAPQPVAVTAELIITLASAVQVAHDAGIVHRDLKPANIFLTADGTPKIGDFGLARNFEADENLTLTGTRIGTPSYMAPEQALGKVSAVGPAADVYSLGAILYEMLTGRPPFRGETAADTERQVIAEQPVPPSRLKGKVPRDLETICLKCLSKEPTHRYTTAAALADDLQRIQRGEAIAARRPGPVERLYRLARRRPAAAALIAVSTLFATVLIGIAGWLAVEDANRRRAIESDLREISRLQDEANWMEATIVLQRVETRLRKSGDSDLKKRLKQARSDLELVRIAVEGANRRRAIESDLREISRLRDEANWTDAGIVLQRAETRLRKSEDGDLNKRLKQARSDLDLVMSLDRIRLNRETSSSERAFYRHRADGEYIDTFEKLGLARAKEAADVVAQRINASAVREAIVAALDDWAICTADKDRRQWILDVLGKADSDSDGWASRIRAAATWDDKAILSELAKDMPVEGKSVSMLLGLGERLRAAGGDATSLFRRVQKIHPTDFWANMLLGDSLLNVTRESASMEAGSFFAAALASRPHAAVAHTALGDALTTQKTQKQRDEAQTYYRQALAIDPNYARGHSNLGNFLRNKKQYDEALESFRTAIKIDPNYPWAHLGLAYTLRDLGQDEAALEHYRQYLVNGPTIPDVVEIMRSALIRQGRGEEVRLQWKKDLELDPPDHDAWFGYAELCLFLKNESEYQIARQDLIRRFGETKSQCIAEKTARAILLAPPSNDELQAAINLVDVALAAKVKTKAWIYRYFLFAQGLAEYRQGHFETAITLLEGEAANVLGPCPLLLIAMAQYRLGDSQKARETLDAAQGMANWALSPVHGHDQWIAHILRREAESLILANPPKSLAGSRDPEASEQNK